MSENEKAPSKIGTWNGPAKRQDALPPWHPDREWMTLTEAPTYIKKCYGVNVGRQTIRSWIYDGVRATPDGPESDRIFLRASKFPGGKTRPILLSKEDIDRFVHG